MDRIYKTIGKTIRDRRNMLGLTQEFLAGKVDVSNNFISYIENGRKAASLKTLKKIADALDLSMSDLFKGIHSGKSRQADYASEQILYLIKDKPSRTKKLILDICRTVIKEKSGKKD